MEIKEKIKMLETAGFLKEYNETNDGQIKYFKKKIDPNGQEISVSESTVNHWSESDLLCFLEVVRDESDIEVKLAVNSMYEKWIKEQEKNKLIAVSLMFKSLILPETTRSEMADFILVRLKLNAIADDLLLMANKLDIKN